MEKLNLSLDGLMHALTYSVIFPKRQNRLQKENKQLKANLYWLTDGYKTEEGVGARILVLRLRVEYSVILIILFNNIETCVTQVGGNFIIIKIVLKIYGEILG